MPVSDRNTRCRGERILRGMGATLALPFLDAMLPRVLGARAGAAQPVHRFQTFYVPNGMAMEYWTPKGEGAGVRAVADSRAARAVPGPDARAVGHQGELELHPRRRVRIVSDRHAARRRRPRSRSSPTSRWTSCSRGTSPSDTQVASLELSMDAPANAGACTGNLSCVYTHTLSWRSATQPLPMEWNPRAVFERLFGDSGSTDRDGARGAAAAAQEHSRFGGRQAGEPQARARPGRSDQGQRISPTRFATSSAASSGPRSSSDIELPTIDAAAGRAAGVRGSPGADARPAAAGVPVRSHARHLVHDRQGAERAAVSADRRARSAPPAVASQRHPRAHRADVEDQPVSHAAVLASTWRSCARRRTATARCWITRRSCTARASRTASGTRATTCR